MASLNLCILVICLVVCTTTQQEVSLQTSAVSPAKQALDIVTVSDYKNKQTEDGFLYVYRTSDNSYRIQEGMILNPGTDNEELVVTGTYTYRSGNIETVVEYIADKNGYRPKIRVTFSPILSISPKLLESLSG